MVFGTTVVTFRHQGTALRTAQRTLSQVENVHDLQPAIPLPSIYPEGSIIEGHNGKLIVLSSYSNP